MEIADLIGKRVTVSARTLTVKDGQDKTRGMIRNVENLYDMRANKQIEYHAKLKEIGRDVYMGNLEKILVIDNQMYFLCDDYQYGISKKLGEAYFKMIDTFEKSETINVIHCERVYFTNKRR